MKLYKYCLRCGRILKTQEAKERGFGRICFEKAKVSELRKPLFGGNHAKSST